MRPWNVPPPWHHEAKPEVVDGRSERARMLDAGVETWAARWGSRPFGPQRMRGLGLAKRWGLVQCRPPCNRLLIVRRDQQTV